MRGSAVSEDGAYTAIGALGDDKEAADSTMSGYSESELNDIDAENAKRMRKQKEQEDLERSLAEARKRQLRQPFRSWYCQPWRATVGHGGLCP